MTSIFSKNKTALTFTLTAILSLTTLSPAMASSADGDEDGAAGAAMAAAREAAPTNTYQAQLIEDHEAAVEALLTKARADERSTWNDAILADDKILARFMAIFDIPTTIGVLYTGNGPLDADDAADHIASYRLKLTPFLEDSACAETLKKFLELFVNIKEGLEEEYELLMHRDSAVECIDDFLKYGPQKFSEIGRALWDSGILNNLTSYRIPNLMDAASTIASRRLDLVIGRTKDLFGTLPELHRPDFHVLLHYTKKIHQHDWPLYTQVIQATYQDDLQYLNQTLLRFCTNDPDARFPMDAGDGGLDDKTLMDLRDNPGAYLYHTTFIPQTAWVAFIDHLIEGDREPEALKTSKAILALIKKKYHAWRRNETPLLKAARVSADEGSGAAGAAAAGASDDG